MRLSVPSACVLLLAATPAGAGTVVKGPGDLAVNCDDFHLSPNGTVEAGKDATLVYPDKKGSFAFETFGPKVFSSNGIDVGDWIDRSCGKT